MEVYTCDSVSYVICRNLAFLMLDLETSQVLYSILFCIIEKNTFVLQSYIIYFKYHIGSYIFL